MNNYNRVLKLKSTNLKLRILLSNKIEPLRNEAIELYNTKLYYIDNYYCNPFIYKDRIAEYAKEHNKVQKKINKLLIQYNKVNLERKQYKNRDTKVKQFNLFNL